MRKVYVFSYLFLEACRLLVSAEYATTLMGFQVVTESVAEEISGRSPALHYEKIANVTFSNDYSTVVAYVNIYNYINRFKIMMHYDDVLEIFMSKVPTRANSSLTLSSEIFFNEYKQVKVLFEEIKIKEKWLETLTDFTLATSSNATEYTDIFQSNNRYPDLLRYNNLVFNGNKNLSESFIWECPLFNVSTSYLEKIESERSYTAAFQSVTSTRSAWTGVAYERSIRDLVDVHLLTKNLEADLNVLLDAVVMAKSGKIHPSVLKTVKASYKTKEDFQALVDASDVSIGRIGTNIFFVINLPNHTEKSYTLYKITPVPIWLNDNNYMYIKPSSNYIAISAEGHYILLTDDELQECKYFSGHGKLCKRNPVVYKSLTESCESNLLTGYCKDIENYCDIHLASIRNVVYQSLGSKSNKWIIAGLTNESFHIICNGRLTKSFYIDKSDIVTLSKGCHASSNIFEIPENKDVVADDMFRVPRCDFEQVVKNIKSLLPNVSLFTENHILQNLDQRSYGTVGISLKDIKNKNVEFHIFRQEVVNYFQARLDQYHTTHAVLYFLVCVSIMISGAFIVYNFADLRRCSRHKPFRNSTGKYSNKSNSASNELTCDILLQS